MKKKFWLILLALASALCLALGLAACGGGGPKEKKVALGDSPEQVVKLLGEPYEEESSETHYVYLGSNYLSLLKRSAELEERMLNVKNEKEFEQIFREMAKIETTLASLVYTRTEISFKKNEDGQLAVSEVWYDAACSENAPEKTLAGVLLDGVEKCSHEDLVQGTIDGIGITERYTDGSYRTTPLGDREISFYAVGKNVTWNWEDDGVEHTLSSSLKASIPLGMGATGIYGKTGAYTIPEGMTEIGDYAFRDCDWLTSIVIPEGVTLIGESAFRNCRSFTSITIPESVTEIGEWAFYGCYKLVEVWNYSDLSIEKGDITCGYVAYYAKQVYTTNEESKQTVTDDGYIFYEDGAKIYLIGYKGTDTKLTLPAKSPCGKDYAVNEYAFSYCNSLKSIVIPEGVTSIRSSAFEGCSGLESVTIGSGVTSIGYGAFVGCSGLTSISIPEGVTSIGSSAFELCRGLTSITIPESVTLIGDHAFSNCTGLTSITIPESVTSIRSATFYNCSKLKSVYYQGTADEWGNISIDNTYSENSYLLNATRYYFTEDAPTEEEWAEWDYWWHFDETTGEVIEWAKPQA